MKKMQSLGSILTKFNPVEDKYISREFQKYGMYLAEQLGDMKHKALYIKLAKTIHRSILEEALTFVKAAHKPRSHARLFMWKLKQLRSDNKNSNLPSRTSKTQSAKPKRKAQNF